MAPRRRGGERTRDIVGGPSDALARPQRVSIIIVFNKFRSYCGPRSINHRRTRTYARGEGHGRTDGQTDGGVVLRREEVSGRDVRQIALLRCTLLLCLSIPLSIPPAAPLCACVCRRRRSEIHHQIFAEAVTSPTMAPTLPTVRFSFEFNAAFRRDTGNRAICGIKRIVARSCERRMMRRHFSTNCRRRLSSLRRCSFNATLLLTLYHFWRERFCSASF